MLGMYAMVKIMSQVLGMVKASAFLQIILPEKESEMGLSFNFPLRYTSLVKMNQPVTMILMNTLPVCQTSKHIHPCRLFGRLVEHGSLGGGGSIHLPTFCSVKLTKQLLV